MPKIDMTEEEFEHQQQWTHLGGTVATAKGVHTKILESAGDYFSRGKDEIALAFRSFAKEYDEKVVRPQSAKLQDFIDESRGNGRG